MFVFLVQDVLAVSREGFHVYKSKWWNAVDSLIILAFVASYVIWFSAMWHSGNKWKPLNVALIYHIADVIFSSAVIVFLSNYRFFHLTHILQVGDQIIV